MEEIVNVRIINLKCLEQNNQEMVITANSNKLTLNASRPNDENQQWCLIPNLVRGAKSGGYTLLNKGRNLCAFQPVSRDQVRLNDDPTPYGDAPYCWTLWPAGTFNGEQVWAIQSYDRGDAMNAEGNSSSCDENTRVLFWPWGGGTSNEKWIIQRIN